MEMSGERTIGASRAQVWAALNDPEVLKACIPGCETMEKTSDTSFTATVVQKVGPVKAKFTGAVELTDIVEGESYRISGSGKGGAAGGASGGAAVTLAEAEGGTLLTYQAEAKVTGKIAQLGSRLISGFAKKMADQFFTRFQEEVEGAGEDGASAASAVTGAAGAMAAEGMAEAAATFDQAAQTLDDQSRAAAEGLGDKVDQATGKVEDAASAISDGGAEAAERLRAQAEEVAHDVNEASKDVESKMAEALDSAQHAIEDAVDDVKQAIEDSPVTKKSFWKRLFGG